MNRIYLLLLSLLVSYGASAQTSPIQIKGTFSNDNWEPVRMEYVNSVYSTITLHCTNGGTWEQLVFVNENSSGSDKTCYSNGNRLGEGDYQTWCGDSSKGNIYTNLDVNYEYTFQFNHSSNIVNVTRGRQVVSAVQYYIIGSFNNYQEEQMVQSGDVYTATLSCTGSGTWDEIRIIAKQSTLDGDIVKYYGIATGGSATLSDSNNSYDNGVTLTNSTASDGVKYIPTTLDESRTYQFWFKSESRGDKVWITVSAGGDDTANRQPERDGYYYFYGDMNRWSLNQNCGDKVNINSLGGDDLTSAIWPIAATIPNWCTQAELDEKWLFHECGADYKLPDKISGQTGWYYLDFTDIEDAEGNKGRLCGQFKFTMGYFNNNNANNWGPGGDGASLDYLKNKININEVYTGGEKGVDKRNFQLNCSYVTGSSEGRGPVLYFNPSANDGKGSIYIDGTPNYIYVYYVKVDSRSDDPAEDEVIPSDGTPMPTDWEISDLSQENYYANSKGFNAGSLSSANQDANFNVDHMYDWEAVENVSYNGVTYSKAYRKLIPYGATHRFPIEFNIKVRNTKGLYFPSVVVGCKDIWFIEADVNVYFRYADSTHQPTWVAYNAFANNLGADGTVTSQSFAYSSWKAMETVEAKDPRDGQTYTWRKSPKPLPMSFASGSYALFLTSESAIYPFSGTQATAQNLAEVAINGRDLYYVVPENDPDLEILYSHLKGSYNCNDDERLQINAELLDENGDLVTTYGEDGVVYSFGIYKDGNLMAPDAKEDGEDENTKSGFNPEPFYTPQIDGPGNYFIVVRAVKDGVVHTSTDIYPVFGNE